MPRRPATRLLEGRMVAKRLRDGRRRKAKLGGFAYGSPTFGRVLKTASWSLTKTSR